MTRFRPCIDLHGGCVKQIVGSTLRDDGAGPTENFVSDRSADWYAELYRRDGLSGGHLIMLGKGNDNAALTALGAFPGGLQIGGGITASNAEDWLNAGAAQVIVTSAVFDAEGQFSRSSLKDLLLAVGRDRLVLDLSCKATAGGKWRVAMNRWQTLTNLEVEGAVLDELGESCCEFLIHAVDVEGLCRGVDVDLVGHLASWGKLPMTYAGGARSVADMMLVDELSGGKMDVTIGSALDLFGGSGVSYEDCVKFNRRG